RGEDILRVAMAPVRVDRLLELLSAAGASAGVRGDDDVAVRGEPLPLRLEVVLELADGAAVDAQDRRISRSRLRRGGTAALVEVRRRDEEPVDLRAVLAPELRLGDLAEVELGQQRVV